MNLHPDELQIKASGAYPIVNGELPEHILWYTITPEKVIICRLDIQAQKEITEEFDIRTVQLSCYPSGYSSDSSKRSPSGDTP
ncbi:MAG: hypothetical protein Q4C83_03125 [Candidatus Saccharibacteria bacterium]|nr:hypothetical protein [Candidatus Saccharibacteria bacterium]